MDHTNYKKRLNDIYSKYELRYTVLDTDKSFEDLVKDVNNEFTGFVETLNKMKDVYIEALMKSGTSEDITKDICWTLMLDVAKQTHTIKFHMDFIDDAIRDVLGVQAINEFADTSNLKISKVNEYPDMELFLYYDGYWNRLSLTLYSLKCYLRDLKNAIIAKIIT